MKNGAPAMENRTTIWFTYSTSGYLFEGNENINFKRYNRKYQYMSKGSSNREITHSSKQKTWAITQENGRVVLKLFQKISRLSLPLGFPGGSDGKVSACNEGDMGLIPRSGRSPGEGNGNSLQRSYLGNPMNRGAWLATIRGVAKSQTGQCTHASQNHKSLWHWKI